MSGRRTRVPAVLIVLTALSSGPLSAQGIAFEVGRLFTGAPDWTSYRLSLGSPLAGPLGYALSGVHLGQNHEGGSLWGLGAGLTLFKGGRPGAYLQAGLSGGAATGGGNRFWGDWTAGLGYELRPLSFVLIGAEGRWRELHYGGDQSGFELSVSLGFSLGGGGGRVPREAGVIRPAPEGGAAGGGDGGGAPPLRTVIERSGVPADRVELITGVLQTATDAMGTPYKWGGTGPGGFDCSGLIQYAYGAHGVQLPRRSVDQAREGTRVAKELGALLPGDILTFSTTGGGVSHVGLYLGDGRFIHSASDGVTISVLNAEDTYGRWWYRRWVGARRVVG